MEGTIPSSSVPPGSAFAAKVATTSRVTPFSMNLPGASNRPPDTAFALLSSTPPSGDPVGVEMRAAAWNVATREFLERYRSDYLPWVEQYPAGSVREEAAAALLRRLEKDDLPGYRRIRALVTDPQTLASFPPR